VGFRSRQQLDEHFAKHGVEFGGIDKAGYLRLAQELRDAPAGGDILQIVRGDGTVSRFDRVSGAFIAFDSDGTIRTFFKPNDGERYFQRQAERSH
jgi:pyocin large subunit-like protein